MFATCYKQMVALKHTERWGLWELLTIEFTQWVNSQMFTVEDKPSFNIVIRYTHKTKLQVKSLGFKIFFINIKIP